MRQIAIIDTCVLLNLLRVPGQCQDADEIAEQFAVLVAEATELLLPVPVLVETGNHIAALESGGQRRQYARMLDQFIGATEGPVRVTLVDASPDEVARWRAVYVDRIVDGLGMADASMVALHARLTARNLHPRTFIWSVDAHLRGYDTPAR